jgi:hypothetical protein
MPGYGLLPKDQGTGLLNWHEVERRLATSHDYWVARVWPDGRPHLMPVWGVWDGQAFWFSSSARLICARDVTRRIVRLQVRLLPSRRLPASVDGALPQAGSGLGVHRRPP